MYCSINNNNNNKHNDNLINKKLNWHLAPQFRMSLNLERADSGLMRCFEQVYHILVLDMLYGSHLSTGTCLRKKKVGKWNLAENKKKKKTIGQTEESIICTHNRVFR